MNEKLHMKPGVGPCDIHDWSEEDLRTKLSDLLRATHDKGGTNICHECVDKLVELKIPPA